MMTNPKNLDAISSIACRDWLIMQSAIPRMASQLMQIPGPADKLDDINIEDFFELREDATMGEDGIAEIHVHSALVDSAPKIHEKLGVVTQYSTIEAEINQALEMGAKGIMFVIDSPGGTVAGNVELADMIAGLDVPTVSFCSGLACSAAYKIAAGTDKIIASPSASVGNIGTILSWVNMEAFWESMGVKWEAITSEGADLKSTFHVEPNATQREFLQESINQAGEQFRNHVIEGRANSAVPLSDEVFRAGWYSGERAGELGLIDGLGNRAEARAVLSDLIDTNQPITESDL